MAYLGVAASCKKFVGEKYLVAKNSFKLKIIIEYYDKSVTSQLTYLDLHQFLF